MGGVRCRPGAGTVTRAGRPVGVQGRGPAAVGGAELGGGGVGADAELADTDVAHFARFRVALVLNGHLEHAGGGGHGGGTTVSAYAGMYPRVEELVVEAVRSRTYTELREEGALERLTEELSEEVRHLYGDHETQEPSEEIYGIAFTEFLIQ